ncbi:MAG: hypothetical protein Q9218_007058, partial [Villophora microphyllina]
MYTNVTALFILAIPCLARSASNKPIFRSLNANSPFTGFPASSLPISFSKPTTNTTSTSPLAIPLNPYNPHETQPVIYFNAANPPRGIELVASIAIRIYRIWLNTTNPQITTRIVDRSLPYLDFEFITQPFQNPGAVLNPLKVGLAYCWILRLSLDANFIVGWPGQIVAVIEDPIPGGSNETLEAGTVSIVHKPFHPNTPDTSDSIGTTNPPNNTAPITSTITPTISPTIDKKWLSCWSAFFLNAL